MNPKTRVYYQGKQIRTVAGRFDSLKAKFYRFIRKVLQFSAVVAILALVFAFGGAFYSTQTITVSANTIEVHSNILDRIADCESGNGTKGSGKQFLSNGNVVTLLNTNGSIDVGKYQINQSVSHLQLEAKLGLNVLTLEGNTAMANYIYANEGTSPWSSSQHCWSR